MNPEERHVVATVEGEANNVEANKVEVETNNTEKQTVEIGRRRNLSTFSVYNCPRSGGRRRWTRQQSKSNLRRQIVLQSVRLLRNKKCLNIYFCYLL